MHFDEWCLFALGIIFQNYILIVDWKYLCIRYRDLHYQECRMWQLLSLDCHPKLRAQHLTRMFLVLSSFSGAECSSSFRNYPVIHQVPLQLHNNNFTALLGSYSDSGTGCIDIFSCHSLSQNLGHIWLRAEAFSSWGMFLVSLGRSFGQFVGQEHYLVLREGRSLHLFNVWTLLSTESEERRGRSSGHNKD